MKPVVPLLPLLPTILALPPSSSTPILPRQDTLEMDRGVSTDLTVTTYTAPNCAGAGSGFDMSYSTPQTASQAIQSYNLSRALQPLEYLDFSLQPQGQGPGCGLPSIPCECMLFSSTAPVEAGVGCREVWGGGSYVF